MSFEFIDAADVIFFGDDGSLLKEKTESALKERLSFTQRAIIPGFYGSMPDGKIRTFSRGGSDITGALIAAACDADVYENFTDVDGVMPADPRIVGLLPVIGSISYKELREMSYMGASVLHEDAVSPARSAGIPINIRNTFNPTAEGTFILDKSEKGGDTPGVAGKDGYILINVCLPDGKQRRNSLNSLISILSRHGIEAEHIITGIDLITAIVSEKTVLEKEKEIIKAICLECDAPIAEIKRNRSLVATIGKSVGLPFLARLLEEFGKRDIDVSEMSYGSGENLLFFCIPTAVKNSAVKAAAGVILEKAGERKPQTLKIKDI